MTDNIAFLTLIQRIRQGDAEAASELVRTYEPDIRRAARMYLTDPRLHRVLDSVDICQSVLANFFVRAASGQFDLQRPEQLLQLLLTMTCNKFRDHARRQFAQRRDQRRNVGDASAVLSNIHDQNESPSDIVAARDLLEQVRLRLNEEERYLAEQRALGREWGDLATELGQNADALRKRLERAMNRVLRDLGVDEDNHE